MKRLLGIGLLLVSAAVQAEWQNDATGLAWLEEGRIVWKYNFDPALGKTHFYPLGLAGGPSLVIAAPDDHPWHYGLWFSWKYINGSNYWEQDRESGKSEGETRWTVSNLRTRKDGSASLALAITYTNQNGQLDLTENRTITVSKPAKDGSYRIDWDAVFTAGPAGATLDRTPMPGEPKGQVNGGYGGLGLRLQPPPHDLAFITPEGPIEKFDSNRARPASSAVAANFSEDGRPVGGIAVFSRVNAQGPDVPWYVVDASMSDSQMRFFNQSLLAPRILKLAPREKLRLGYRIGIAPSWSAASLRSRR